MTSLTPQIQPGTEPALHELELHGHRVCFRYGGEGPLIVLIHGITGNSAQWELAIDELADEFTILAPDLLGHGQSAKPRGDYSLGAYASGIRDILLALGHERASIVGHSLGGGVAMQFAYQFPERCERLVLVSSGGLGREVHPLLRAATLPGAELVLPLLTHARLLAAGEVVGRILGALKLEAGPDLAEFAAGYASLGDSSARAAFLQTARAVIDAQGQRVSALDRLYLAEAMPSMVIWGAEDPIIPVEHGRAAHEAMPGSRFEVFERAGHFPQLADPRRFARLLREFIDSTEPSDIDTAELRDQLLSSGAGLAAVPVSAS
jgi:pimeloyl-ACP methyl ester carboxylesterase